jgi:hypothetical protein
MRSVHFDFPERHRRGTNWLSLERNRAMKNVPSHWIVTAAVVVFVAATWAAEPNTLTDQERAEGWILLFDGKSLGAWRGIASTEVPAGWDVHDGAIRIGKATKAGDIITREKFGNFDFRFEFRLTPGANSGVKYFVDPARAQGTHGIGCEYQILDDERHPDAKARADGSRTLAALYDILPPAPNKPVRPVGEWNEGRIVVRGPKVEHWLNGVKVVEYDRSSPEFRAAVAKSKFAKMAGFGEWAEGHILLQDHNDEVHYRNLKIRRLD